MILAEQANADWWARGIGIAALLVSAIAFGWRVFEWWRSERVRFRVVGTAGTIKLSQGLGQHWLYQGPRQPSYQVAVTVANQGREATIDEAGFLPPPGRSDGLSRIALGPQPGQLPKRLKRGEYELIWGHPRDEMLALVVEGVALVPYCRDGEGHIHTGETNEHYARFVKETKDRAQEAQQTNLAKEQTK
ncbi:MAG TPA: hypothetical protein VIP09_06695 [Dehalococcoidia bacterium]|jgi:hypothetical protein